MDYPGQVVGVQDPGAGINGRSKSNQNEGAGMREGRGEGESSRSDSYSVLPVDATWRASSGAHSLGSKWLKEQVVWCPGEDLGSGTIMGWELIPGLPVM